MDTKQNGYAFRDRNSHTWIYVGDDRKGRPQFLVNEGDRVIHLVTKSVDFWYTLTPMILHSPKCLYYLSREQCVQKLLDIYSEANSIWRADAKRAAHQILGKRIVRIDFENPKEIKRYKKKDKTGIVSLQQICQELKLDDMEVRKYLRETMKKPGGRWEWPEAQVAEVKAKIKQFFK